MFEKNYGGKGGNQAVQCGRLGINVGMNATVGCDEFGSDYIKQLALEGVDSSRVSRSNHLTTGIASISVDASGQNCIIIVPGANLDFSAETVHQNEAFISNSKVLICQNEISHEATLSALKHAQQHRTVAIFNPAPVSESAMEVLPFCDIVCPNETELSSLTEGMPIDTNDDIQAAATSLLSKGCKVVVVTLGGRGACIVTESGCEFIAAPTVNAIDTVGAGDSFIGMFQCHVACFTLLWLGSLASNIVRGANLKDAVFRAIQCASISVTRKGAQKSCPVLAELPEEYRPPAFSSLTKDDIRRRLGLVR